MEKWPEPCQDRLNLAVRHDGKYNHLAAGIIKHQMPLMKAIMPLTGYVVDDGIAGGAGPVQELSDKFQLVALHNDLDFLHRVQCQSSHGYLLLAAEFPLSNL